jgi:uncharacterized protein (DUF2147 family)
MKVVVFFVMKKISLIVFLLTAAYCSSVAQANNPLQFASEKEARQMINLIVDVVGLKPNFEISAGQVGNAAAVIYKGKRYILYNPVFIMQIKNAIKTDWGGLSILAHEVGHHLNGHTLLGSGSTPSIELEADEFSGFVLRRLGATLEESQMAMRLISDVKGSATHPGRTKRLGAIQAGWNRAEIQIAAATKPVSPKHKSQGAGAGNKAVVARYTFPAKYISYNVKLNALSGETFHITTQHNLVRVTSSGYQVIGRLVHSGKTFYLTFSAQQKLRLNTKGHVLNSAGQKIGYLTKPANS